MRGIRLTCAILALTQMSARADEQSDHFDKTIAPLLARRCLDCHQGAEPKGALDLSRQKLAYAGGESGTAISPGRLTESLLWQRVVDGDMPPQKPLPENERAILKAWIEAGATWGADPIDPFRFTSDLRAGYDWWSLQPVVRPPAPQVAHDWPRHNAIDTFIQARLVEQSLAPSAPVERRALIRRLSIDLLGLPPGPEEVAAYLADTSADATARLVERLLASPHYGERWGRHWLDIARFGESQGFERDKLRTDSWRYRDWLVSAFNGDLPYNDFVRLQVAGDVLAPQSAEAIAATGFLVAGPFDEVGKLQQSAAMKAVVRQDELEDFVGAVSQTFLGLTVNCARCHDHKFDPIRQREYYQLAASLAGVEHGSRNLPPEHVRDATAHAVAAWRAREAQLTRAMAERERVVRQELQGERSAQFAKTPTPEPIAAWTFDDLDDQRGALHATAVGGAVIDKGQLLLDGKEAYVATLPLESDLAAKTLVATVRLADLKQRGGGVFGVQTLDGSEFDTIVFGEREPARWMAGSEFYRRTQSFAAPAETEAHLRAVQIALVYDEDGTITAFRDGVPYGAPYKTSARKTFKGGAAQIVLGVRHAPAGSGKMLAGAIEQALLFDRALTPGEVAKLAGSAASSIATAEIVARLSPADRAWRETADFERAQIADQVQRYQEAKVYAVTPKSPHAVHILARGEPNQPGEEVAAGGIASLVGLSAEFGLLKDATDAQRRQQLAEWLASGRNPLVARTIVNRLWHYHFGVGLVETPNDFGFNGGRPSHPELLDWLASELVESGWSLKHVQRLLVLSATYQQASLPRAEALAQDADNRLVWRKSPQRLDAETLRDAMLCASGEWNAEIAGPGFHDFKTFVLNSQFYEIVDASGPTFHRRSLYRTWIRSGRSPLLDAFDCPDPSTKTPARAITTTPLQALSLLNNAQVLRLSDHTAQRVERAAGEEHGAQVERLYALVFGRSPTAAERATTAAFAREHGLSALVRVLFNSNEFLYVD